MVLNLKDKEENLSGKGLNWSWFGLLDGENESKNADVFRRIAADMDTGTEASKALTKEYANLTKQGQTLGDELVKSGKSLPEISQGFTTAAKSASKLTLASKAATLGMKALAVAGNMALMAGVAFVLSLPSRIAQAQEELRQSALDSAQAFKETTSSIDSYKTKVLELRTALSSGNLSQAEAYDARANLMQIQGEIIDKYGEEAGAIDLVSGSLRDQIDALDEVAIRQANKNLATNKTTNEKSVRKMEAVELYNIGIGVTPDIKPALESLVKEFEASGISIDENQDSTFNIRLYANAEDAEKTLADFSSKLRDLDIDEYAKDNINSYVEGSIKYAQKTLDKWAEVYDNYNFERIITDKNYSKTYKEAEDAVKGYTEAVKSGDQEQIDSAIKTIAAIKQKALSGTDDVGYQDFFESFFSGFQSELDKHQFKIDIEADINGIKGALSDLSGLDDQGILNIGQIEGTEEQEAAFDLLSKKAEEYGTSIEGLIGWLVELGLVQGRIADEPVLPKISTADTINSLSNLQEKFSSIASAAKDFADTGKITMASLAGMSKEFGSLDGYDNLVRVLSDVSPAAEDVERALSSMIGEYIAGDDAIKNIDDSTRALVQSTLEEMDVLNAEEIATSALAQAQNNLAAQKFLAANPDLLNMSIADMQALFNETGAAEQARQAIFNLTMQKALLADSSLSGMAAEGVQSLLNLATAAGITGGAIDQLRMKLALKTGGIKMGMSKDDYDKINNSVINTPAINIPTPKMDWGNFSSGAGGAANSQKDVNEALTEFLALLEHRKSMDEFVENEDEYVKALIYAYQNLTKTEEERRDLAEKIYSAKKSQLENEKSALEGAAQAAMRKYDDEINGVNEVIDRLDEKIKRHEKEKSNLESAHNAVIRLLDKEIEKLRTKYDEEKKQIEDKKSKYEQAHSAVMDAIDAEIKKYEDQKTAIDDLYQPQIDAVQEQIDLLQKKNDETKKEIELEKSKAALASANSQKVNQVYKEGIGFVYEADGDAILDAQQRLDELAREKEISDLEDKKTGLETERDDKKTGIDEQIEVLQKYKDKWDEILSAFEKQQNIDVANSIFGPNWSADVLNGNLDIMNSFKDGYLEIQQQITDITAEQDAANARAEILEQYKEQWQDELDSYKNAEEERLANVVFYAGWEQDVLNGRQEAFNIFKDEYLDIQDKITDDTKKREGLEKDIKRLEQYKEAWQDELDSYQNFESDKKAIELWGADWEAKILNNREEALDEFKVAYGSIQDQIAQISRDSLIPNYNLSQSIDALADANDRYVQSIYDRITAEEEARVAKKSGYSGEGYASGTSHGKQGWHRVDEFGTEAKMGKMNGNYAFIKDGDVVFNRSQTEFLYNFSQMHQPAMLNRMAEDYMKMAQPLGNVVNVPVTPSVTQVTQRFDNITLPNVKDFQDFLSEIGRIGLDARQINFKR